MGSIVLWVGWSHQSSDATFDRTRNGRLRKLAPKNLSKKAKMSHRIKPRMWGDENEVDEYDDNENCSLWLQWSPSNPGWHWHLPRTQAPCPWHPFTQPSVNSCKMPLLEVCDLVCRFVCSEFCLYVYSLNLVTSPESSEALEQHCVHRRHRCKRRQTSGPPPWRSLASVEPASEKNVAFDSDLKNIGWARSFFIWNLGRVWN